MLEVRRRIRLTSFHVFDVIDVLRQQNRTVGFFVWELILTNQLFYSAAVISDAEILLCVCMYECTYVCVVCMYEYM